MGLAMLAERDLFSEMMASAQSGDVIVADVFAALRHGEITEEEAKQILRTFERAKVSPWQRFIISST